MSYASVSELKSRLNITSTDASRDSVMTALLNAAEEAINGLCNRPHGFIADAIASARYYHGSGSECQRIDECTEITTVSIKSGTTYTDMTTPTTYFTGDGDWVPATGSLDNPEYNRTPYTMLLIDSGGSYGHFPKSTLPNIKVTARWGYADSVPAHVKEACVVLASRWWKRGESGWADSAANPDMGALQFRQSIDPDVKAMLIEARLVVPAIG
jgi:hypothetical protein